MRLRHRTQRRCEIEQLRVKLFWTTQQSVEERKASSEVFSQLFETEIPLAWPGRDFVCTALSLIERRGLSLKIQPTSRDAHYATCIGLVRGNEPTWKWAGSSRWTEWSWEKAHTTHLKHNNITLYINWPTNARTKKQMEWPRPLPKGKHHPKPPTVWSNPGNFEMTEIV